MKKRLYDLVKTVDPLNIEAVTAEEIQKQGMSMRKANYIKMLAHKIISGEFDPGHVKDLSDEQVVKALTVLPGIGVWTAEMLMIFSLQRQNILSRSDLGIKRGISGLYNIENPDNTVFEHYKNIYSPYSSIASLYLWEFSANTATKDPTLSLRD